MTIGQYWQSARHLKIVQVDRHHTDMHFGGVILLEIVPTEVEPSPLGITRLRE